MTRLLLTVHFLDDRYHGLLDRRGPPEWPPSPFRLFQAMVAGIARRGELGTDVGKSLEWLQTLEPPLIIAPKARTGQAITRFVPNNDGDKKFDRQERLTAKPTIPTLFLLDQDEKPEVHYVWNVTNHADAPIDRIRDAARSLTCLGWGIDMAFADARTVSQSDAELLPGIRWYPKEDVRRSGGTLRVPTVDAEYQECTLSDLRRCHQTAIERIEHGKPLHTVEKPRVFKQVFYASTERPIPRPYEIFKLCDNDNDRIAHPQRQLIHLAGMVRHLAIEQMEFDPPAGVEDGWVRRYVAGHQDAEDKKAGKPHMQFSYLPLPSIRQISEIPTDPSVRLVMIAAPVGHEDFLTHLAKRLDGLPLKPLPGTPIEKGTRLERIDGGRSTEDKVSYLYTQPANTWASVTPVILPGHDDHKAAKTSNLIEKALAQSGIEQPCEFEWSPFSMFPKSLSAHKYDRQKRLIGYIRPGHLLNQTAVHLTLRFNDGLKIPGPLVIGAGRHCGLGVLATIN